MTILSRKRRPGTAYFAGAPLLIAHRGGAALAPENTLGAFHRALKWWGADILELDVQPTRDGNAVVFHDSTLERTTDGRGPVSAHTTDELRQLDAGYHFRDAEGGTPFRNCGVTIPTFAEILAAFPSIRMNVEIKNTRVQKAVGDAVREAGAEQRVLIAAGQRRCRSQFSDYAGAVSASAEELRRFYAAFRLRSLALYRPSYDALQMPERYGGFRVLTPSLIEAAHAMNLAVHVWTVDEEGDMKRLLDWGVDGIVTDRPDRLARILHETHHRPLPQSGDEQDRETLNAT
ncbi:glycerophosphodiester phosphodiesterase [soil metagenome]